MTSSSSPGILGSRRRLVDLLAEAVLLFAKLLMPSSTPSRRFKDGKPLAFLCRGCIDSALWRVEVDAVRDSVALAILELAVREGLWGVALPVKLSSLRC